MQILGWLSPLFHVHAVWTLAHRTVPPVFRVGLQFSSNHCRISFTDTPNDVTHQLFLNGIKLAVKANHHHLLVSTGKENLA